MTDQPGSSHLRSGSVNLPEVLFQSITFMAPGIGIAFAIGIGVPLAGTALPLALLIALVACSFAAVAIGQLAARMPSAGGLYAYAQRALGNRAGFTVGWYYLAFAILLTPFFALQEGWFVDAFLRSRGYTSLPGIWLYVVVYMAAVFGLTFFDVKLSVRTSMVLGGVEMLVFIALGLTMVGHGPNSTAPFHPSSAPAGWSGIAQAASFGVLAFIGFEAAASFGEEAKNPRRAIPIAVIASAVGVGVFYLFLTYAWNVGSGMKIEAYNSAHSGNDWPAFAQHFWGDAGSWIVFLALLNSIIAAGASAMNSSARVLFAMGRAGQLPRALGKTHSKHRTPHVAIIISLVASGIVAALAGAKFGAAVGYGVVGETFTILAILVYMIMCVSCVRYFVTTGRSERRTFLHIVVPALGFLAFLIPLYAQGFDLGALFDGSGAFKWSAVYPFNWAVWTAIAWIGAGLIAVVVLGQRITTPAVLAESGDPHDDNRLTV